MTRTQPKSATARGRQKTTDGTHLPSLTNLDAPIKVKGVITDPLRDGYQILYNYESNYWRALIGNDAWGLYEVLRSFCHDGNNTCYPSIHLLTIILGLMDKRAIIGRRKTVNGKEYCYPGLLEILQEHKLVIAEIQGEEPQTHYLFHVTLTPARLTDEQVAKLPQMLQEKHAELIERCQQKQQELEAKRRPSKFQNSDKNIGGTPDRGVGNSHGGDGNFPRGDGNFPPEQHQYNTTQLTIGPREDTNNNSSVQFNNKQDVVVALTSQGIAEEVAKRLADHYSQERITEKLEFLSFLLEEQPGQVNHPRGWLRRAIEKNYGPPDGFIPKAERERIAQEQQERDQQIAFTFMQTQVQQEQQIQTYRDYLSQTYATAQDDFEFWAVALKELSFSFAADKETFRNHIETAEILRVTEEEVWIGFKSEFLLKPLTHPGIQKKIERSLTVVAGRPLRVKYEVIKLPIEAAESLLSST